MYCPPGVSSVVLILMKLQILVFTKYNKDQLQTKKSLIKQMTIADKTKSNSKYKAKGNGRQNKRGKSKILTCRIPPKYIQCKTKALTMGGKILPEECPHNIGEPTPHTHGTQPCSPWNCFSCSMADDTNNTLLPPLHCDVSFGMLVEEHLIWEILSTICFGSMSASVSLAASAQIWPGVDQGHYKIIIIKEKSLAKV